MYKGAHASCEISWEPARSTSDWSKTKFGDQDLDFGEVKVQQHVKRAEVADKANRTFSFVRNLLPN